MTHGGTSPQKLPSSPARFRQGLGYLLIGLSICLLVASTLFTYELTREYGYSPNDDPSSDLVRAAIGNALFALLITMLAAGGLALMERLPQRRRLVWLPAVFAAAFVLLGLGMAAGQAALEARCAGPERASTGAC